MLTPSLPALNDPEGDKIPASMPFVVDAHVHVFPSAVFRSIWKWFDDHAWPIRYRFNSHDLLNFLLSRGISHIIALQYAHKPGIARELNRYMAGLIKEFRGSVSGLATVYPGEKDAHKIIKEAFKSGLKGLKLHAHVQCFDLNSSDMDIIYDVCASEKKPVVIHAGREPKSPAYECDPYLLCSAEKLEKVVKNFPELKVCVPHMGLDEISHYRRLIEKYDNLWLDTAMVLADYFPGNYDGCLHEMRADRIMYGSDFPNIPYAWDREIKKIQKMDVPVESFSLIMGRNSIDFFSLGIECIN